MKVGIINVTGYSGSELARLLYSHPEVRITSVTGRSAAGQKLGEVFPHLSDLDMVITPELDGSLDLVFSALPHKASAEAIIPLLEDGIKVVDISADFRLRKLSVYEEWYGVTHPGPQYLEEAVYGLTELNRSRGCPGPSGSQPGLLPHQRNSGAGTSCERGPDRAGHRCGQQVGGLRRGAWPEHGHSLF